MTRPFTTTVLVCEVGEAPDVAEPDGVPEGGEDEVTLAPPPAALCFLVVVLVLLWVEVLLLVGNSLYLHVVLLHSESLKIRVRSS